jgi:iron(III) transport system permease protein
LGVPTAWLVTRYEFPGRQVLKWALILPLAIPTYIAAYAYSGIFSFKGPINHWLHLQINIMNLPGIMAVLSLVLYPYIYLISRTSFAVQSRQHLEASRILGKNAWKTFFRVALPLSRAAIFGGVGLVVMELLNDYGAMKYFGITTFTTGIFRAWFSIGDLNSAIRLAICLVVFVLGLFAAEKWQRGRARFTDRSQHTRTTARVKLTGWWAATALAVCALPFLLGFIAPMLQLLSWSMQTIDQVLTPDFLLMVGNSVGLALVAACICTLAAFFVVFARTWSGSVFLQGISRAATVGYAIPGAVIAIGVMIPLLWLSKPLQSSFGFDFSILLNDTVVVLVFAYLVRFLAVTYNSVESTYRKMPGSITEASRILGKGAGSTLTGIHFPLVKGGLLTAFILVFVDVMKELPLTLILRPFNFNTLATKAFELAGDDRIIEAANPALIIIIAGLIPILILNRMLAKNEG